MQDGDAVGPAEHRSRDCAEWASAITPPGAKASAGHLALLPGPSYAPRREHWRRRLGIPYAPSTRNFSHRIIRLTGANAGKVEFAGVETRFESRMKNSISSAAGAKPSDQGRLSGNFHSRWRRIAFGTRQVHGPHCLWHSHQRSHNAPSTTRREARMTKLTQPEIRSLVDGLVTEMGLLGCRVPVEEVSSICDAVLTKLDGRSPTARQASIPEAAPADGACIGGVYHQPPAALACCNTPRPWLLLVVVVVVVVTVVMQPVSWEGLGHEWRW